MIVEQYIYHTLHHSNSGIAVGIMALIGLVFIIIMPLRHDVQYEEGTELHALKEKNTRRNIVITATTTQSILLTALFVSCDMPYGEFLATASWIFTTIYATAAFTDPAMIKLMKPMDTEGSPSLEPKEHRHTTHHEG